MVEFILGMTLLNSVLILYFHYQQQEVNKEILELSLIHISEPTRPY